MKGLVLVAEDEAVSQKMAIAVIENCGFTARVVADGKSCLDVIQQGLQPDLLLLDLEMPVVDGLGVLKVLKQQKAIETCPVVVFTAHHEAETVKEAIRLGADDLLVKPYQPLELGRRIRDLIFDISELELRDVLGRLHFQDKALGEQPTLQQLGQGSDYYPVAISGRSVCVAIPKGMAPQALAKEPMMKLVLSLMIFRKGMTGWRKVWPKADTLDLVRKKGAS